MSSTTEIPFEKLLQMSKLALDNSYCPYSKLSVAASLLAEDGRIFTGVNVENVSYGLTMCAERTAIASAVSQSCQKFKAIMVVSSCKSGEYIMPCGACRQVLAEFGTNWTVCVGNKIDNSFKKFTVGELLPSSFLPENLEKC